MSEPKPRVEVTEETTERLEVLELDRTPRPEKLAAEQALAQGASEVRYEERQLRPRHPATLDEIRAKVDALQAPQRRALPEAPPLPPPPAPIVVPRPVSDEHHAALAPVVQGKLLQVDTVYKTDAGEVVEAKWEAPEGARSQTFLIEDGRARPMDDVESRIDALPQPFPPVASLPAQKLDQKGAEGQGPAPEPKRKLGLPSLGRKPKDAPAPPSDEPKKRRFGFGRK
jgi:hypothetical protein